MAAELWIRVLLTLVVGSEFGEGAQCEMAVGGKAIYLSTYELENETYNGMEKNEHKQKTWCNQCMWKTSKERDLEGKVGGNGTPTTMSWSWLGESYGWENYEIKNVANGTYEAHKEYELMNDEGMEVEYDEGKEVKYDMVGGMSLAVMNKFYRNINGMVYMMNFVYINGYEYLTAELYMVMVTIYALWMWRKRSTRKRTRKARKSHLSYKYKLRGKVLRPEVPWSEDSSQGLTEHCGLEVGEDAVCMFQLHGMRKGGKG